MPNLKPTVVQHLPGYKAIKMMGATSARLVVAVNGPVPGDTDAECFAAVRALVAYAAKLKLNLNPATTCFPDEAFDKRTPAQVLALVETCEAAGMNCWVSRKGNMTIGNRSDGRPATTTKAREKLKGEDAALALFMKAIG